MSTATYDRGELDCILDRCENVPFASVGGLDKRCAMKAPKYIKDCDKASYLKGYRDTAKRMYGEDWQTYAFSWQHVMTIGDDDG